jgi:hypothetical protein
MKWTMLKVKMIGNRQDQPHTLPKLVKVSRIVVNLFRLKNQEGDMDKTIVRAVPTLLSAARRGRQC